MSPLKLQFTEENISLGHTKDKPIKILGFSDLSLADLVDTSELAGSREGWLK